MKVYVINIESDTERLQHFYENYPTCLPEYTVWKAKTGVDVVKPNWWQSSANRWALVQNFIDILSTDTTDDILIFEDDCTFSDDFEEKYTSFLNEVPDDWDMLYLGAYHLAYPIQVSSGVLKLENSVCGHAVIYRNRIKQELVEYYKAPNWGCIHMPDMRRAQAMSAGKFKAYSPLINICGQDEGKSRLVNTYRVSRWYNTFKYVTPYDILSEIENGRQRTIMDSVDPIPELADKEICSVSVIGDNIFYAVCFLLTVQELKQTFNMPIVCHVDAINKERLIKMAAQEAIDISDVIFIEHQVDNKYASTFLRYTPVGAAITHVFDVDNKLHPAQYVAINDFRENGSEFDVYTCNYSPGGNYPVLAGSIGFRESLLVDLFNVVKKATVLDYGADELLLTKYLSNNLIPCLIYKVNGSGRKCNKALPAGVVKNIDMEADSMRYTSSDFEKLVYYSNGKYHIDDKEYIVHRDKH